MSDELRGMLIRIFWKLEIGLNEDAFVSQVDQAYKDAGYVKVGTPFENFLEAQEFYDRFETEIQSRVKVNYSESEVLKAAKRAAGLPDAKD